MLCLLSILPPSASSIAPQVDHLFLFVVLMSAFFAALIFILLFVFAIKYRRRSPDEIPVQIPGHIMWETTWTVIPIIIVIILFVWGAQLFIREAKPPSDCVHVYVVAKQWMWKLQHPEGPREIDTLHVPVDEPVELVMTSQDVIHDFSVPAFRVKMDV
ncbi:MAG: cytochrome c oxidase subunit II transmembrane domain-containing protein, partial [Terriglobia bacterium]